jgi:pyridoxamine 5'-phosphate oxidase
MDKKINETLQNLRVRYKLSALDIEDCDSDPIEQFDKWLEHAIETHCDEPNAFVLSTIHENKPRARVLLLKGIENGKLIFYTNYESAKGQELADNPNASMTFLWLPLHRQVRIEGKISKIGPDESDTYFHKRPRGSQLGAIASPQSRKVSSRAELEKMFHNAEEKFKSIKLLPRPSHWGGYALSPEYFEYWQGRDNRMHDRIGYSPKDGSWEKFRLAP